MIRRLAVAAVAAAFFQLGTTGQISTASAQAISEPQKFPLDRMRISTDSHGILDVESARAGQPGDWSLLFWGEWVNDPLVVRMGEQRLGSLVGERMDINLGGSYTIFSWLRVGADLPIVLHQTRDQTIQGVGTLSKLQSAGVGDLRIVPKIQLLRQDQVGFELALLGTISIPTGKSSAYLDEAQPTWVPGVAVSRTFDKIGLRIGANLAYRWRKDTTLLDIRVDDEFEARGGAALRLDAFNLPPFEIGAALLSATSASRFYEKSNVISVEGQTYLAYNFKKATVFASVGEGLRDGFATPDWRLLAGVRPIFETRDRDKDGIPDDEDKCPDDPEDKDSFEDLEGCPDPDNDKDGIPDVADKCPNNPEDKDGFEDADGCPDPDNDKDGIPDTQDRCPNEPGPKENGGCPDTDRDKDGIVDRLDKCPDVPGVRELDGCPPPPPPPPPPRKKIEIIGKIEFETNKAVIRPESFHIVDQVVKVMKENGHIKLVRVEGHTDSRGKARKNRVLSQQRAESVVRYLVEHGIAAERLVAKGYGPDRPIDDNASETGRDRNRRVEFTILEGALNE